MSAQHGINEKAMGWGENDLFVLHFDLFLQKKNEVPSPQKFAALGGLSSEAQRKIWH